MKTALFLIGAVMITQAQAQGAELQAPDFELRAGAKKDGMLVLVATPPAGHHVNVEAPMSANTTGAKDKRKPVDAAPKRVRFEVPADAESVTVNLFLCDDAGKFCESHTVTKATRTLAQAPSADAAPVAVAATQPRNPAPKNPADEDLSDELVYSSSAAEAPPEALGGMTDEHGFLVNEPTLALELAHKGNKPLLIDFFGIWCPPCNQYDAEVFSTKSFHARSANFIKLKLDADSPISWQLKSRFKIGGYPTIVFASPSGDEISRVVGFRPEKLFLAELDRAWKSRSEPFTTLLARADRGNSQAAQKVGRVYLERGEFDLAVMYLEKAFAKGPDAREPKHLESLWNARIGLAGRSAGTPETDAQLARLIESAIRELPRMPGTLEWQLQLADLYEGQQKVDPRKAILDEHIKTAEHLIANPTKFEGYDLTVVDLLTKIADAHEALGREDAAKAAWKKTAAEYQRRIARIGNPKVKADEERGYNLERAYALWKSGDVTAAETIYKKLQIRFPTEFTYYFSHARMNFDLKRYAEAETLGQAALKYAYGDNRLRVAEFVAKVLKQQNRRDEARTLVKEALATARLPEDSSIRSHRYAKALRKLEKELSESL
ncbi:MAG TPA: thioredoxin fold domain-containing protein [Bdellovibrionota bacterium]|nr:thioredoxin fold domain-containing protein [Bdellovibrionota bacterium]